MGENFLRKKTEQFSRLRNLGFVRLLERTLFSTRPASVAINTVGSLCTPHPPPAGMKVWPQLEDDGSISFYAGLERCVRVPKPRADALHDLIKTGTVVGEVVEADLELGHVRLSLTPLDGDLDARPTQPL